MFANILKILILVFFIVSCKGKSGAENLTTPTPFSEKLIIKNNFVAQVKIPKEKFYKIFNSLSGLNRSFSSTTQLSFKGGLKTCLATTSLSVKFDESSKKYFVESINTKNSGSCNGNSPNKKFQTKKELRLDAFLNLVKNSEVEISKGLFDNKPGYLISLIGGKADIVYMLGVNDTTFDFLIGQTIYNQDDGYLKITTEVVPLKTFQIDANLVEDIPETGDIIELSEFGVISFIN